MAELAQQKDFVCTQCPWGCVLHVSLNTAGEVIEVEGNACPRGEKYGRAEATEPQRVLTTLVDCNTCGFGPASVKSSEAIPKASMAEALALAHDARVDADVELGDVVIKNIAGSGAHLIVTRPPSKLF